MFSSPEILEYHRKLLNLPHPWEVGTVDMSIEDLTVTIDVFWPAQTLAPCPECQELGAVRDLKPRIWRHLDTMQFKTFLRCDVPRVDCPEHGTLQMFLPWSDPKSRFTALFEKVAAAVLRSCKNQTQAAHLLRLSWKQIHRIQHLAVEKALSERKKESIQHLGIDEKSFLKGHKYVTVMSDLDKKRVLDVVRNRDESAVEQVLQCLSDKQKDAVKAVAMDMWEPFRTVVERKIPKAAVVHDRFHISGYLTKGVDLVRKNEHRELMKQGIETLKGTKYLWLTNQYNWDDKQRIQYRELRRICLKVGRAFSIKEAFRKFWTYYNKGSAEKFFKHWYFWATHSGLKPMIEVARTLKRHVGNILTYFQHRISNSASEGLNAKIQLLKADARGFRNFENFRIAILFHCGGFDFIPHKWA
jgi:transposase